MKDITFTMNKNESEAKENESADPSEEVLISHYETLIKSNEVEELKYRISQLEHLVVSSTANNSASAYLDPSTTRLTPHGLIQRVSHLESLLAASELDNQRLEREVQLLNASKQEQEGDFFRSIKEKDIRIKNLEQDIELFEVKISKTTKTIASMEAYINTLPSQQELDEANQALTKFEFDNDMLVEKLNRLEISLSETQQILSHKESLYNIALQRIEELQPIEEAQKLFLQGSNENATEPNLIELPTVQKTQLIRYGKIIQSQRRKLCEFETERAELVLQLLEKSNLLSALEDNIKSYHLQMENFKKQIKNHEEGKYQLETEVQNLQRRVNESESLIALKRNEMSNLILLVTEVDYSIKEMNKLVLFCQTLSSGDEVSLDVMLGVELDDFDDDNNAKPRRVTESDENNSNGNRCKSSDAKKQVIHLETKNDFDIDIEWILERLKLVRDLRTHIKTLRSQVNEIYTDLLSSGVSDCRAQ